MGASPNPFHDLGTDLFLQVRDERRFDLGLLVGAQVKAGDSWFAEPVRDDNGTPTGWWFRDADRRHIDAWLAHAIPHLLILHDLRTRTSYWAAITDEAVESTGVGAKIFVPAANVVAEACRDALMEVAYAGRPAATWEGSVWLAGSAVRPRDRLRHALIVPRLVAPHPNAGLGDTLAAEQAIAMLMQARLGELNTAARELQHVPQLGSEAARTSPEWAWRFASALHDRATDDSVDGLGDAFNDAAEPAHRAAAAVAFAAALIERAEVEAAIAVLDAALEPDDAEPVDHAWMLIQRSRAQAEIGRLEVAREGALRAQGARLAAPDDATAGAISASAALLLFNTAGWDKKDLEALIKGIDTPTGWWRAQTTARGLGAIVDRSFDAWVADRRSVVFGREHEANNELHVAALTASHAADQAGWRNHAAEGARNTLLQTDRNAAPEIVAGALAELRQAGDEKTLKGVVRRVVANGPAVAATWVAAGVDLEVSTRTTGAANLALLAGAGDVLDRDTAARTVAWLLSTLHDPSAFVGRTTPSYLVELRLVEVLRAVVGAAEDRLQREVAERVLAQPGVSDQLLARAWGGVVRALPDGVWDAALATRAREAAAQHEPRLRLPLLGAAAKHDEQARASLVDALGEGGLALDALSAFGDVRRLPGEAAGALAVAMADAVARIVADAREGRHGSSAGQVVESLLLVNVWHPNAARWAPVVELLRDPTVAADVKADALRRLARSGTRLPASVRAEIGATARAIAEGEIGSALALFGGGDAVGEAAYAATMLGALEPSDVATLALRLSGGDADDRAWGAVLADVADPAWGVGVLASAIADPEPEVRAAAAAGVARRVVRGEGGELAAAALEVALGDGGVVVARAVAETMGEVDGDGDAGTAARSRTRAAVRARLRDHASASVRRVVGG